jgi:predicted dienelactone hydrolase
VAAGRVGVLGHSFGGNTVLFRAAVDDRVAFAVTSGAAGTYRDKLANEIGSTGPRSSPACSAGSTSTTSPG